MKKITVTGKLFLWMNFLLGMVCLTGCHEKMDEVSGTDYLPEMITKTAAVTDPESFNTSNRPMHFRDLEATEIVAEMATGWNLGNTLDAHLDLTPNETIWQNYETSPELIKSIHDMGFNTVRIPVTWGTMISDDYIIDEKWLSRVQDIVDYCIEEDMYVLINLYHDGDSEAGWIELSADENSWLYEKYAEVWRSIANYFKDYDEHLIFESMNAVHGDDNHVLTDIQMLNELNQIFVDAVRSTGSNNTNRWLSVVGRDANIEYTANSNYGFVLPKDTTPNRLFVSVQFYDQYFSLEQSPDYTEFTEKNRNYIKADCQKLYNQFVRTGIPVIMSEYGAANKNNSEQRACYGELYNYLCRQNGIVPIWWDDGGYNRRLDSCEYQFALVDRKTGRSIDSLVTDAIMRGYYYSPRIKDAEDIKVEAKKRDISWIEMEEEEISMMVGEEYTLCPDVVPTYHSDVLLWRTENPQIATVHNGHVIARGIGRTKLEIYSQSGTLCQTIPVRIVADDTAQKVTQIYPVKTSYELNIGEYTFLEFDYEGGDENTTFSYSSLDEEVVRVSRLGKIVARKEGEAIVIVRANTGAQMEISVKVKPLEEEKSLKVAVNVLYNDAQKNFFENEIGEVIEISQNGEYTITFDCKKHLSEEAQKAGVDSLEHLTAIYLKDYQVSCLEATSSEVVNCEIVYQSVTVDGVSLTLNTRQRYPAIKKSNIFDTDGPINAWDKTVVEEVKIQDHVVDFDIEGIEKPQQITICFTICNYSEP